MAWLTKLRGKGKKNLASAAANAIEKEKDEIKKEDIAVQESKQEGTHENKSESKNDDEIENDLDGDNEDNEKVVKPQRSQELVNQCQKRIQDSFMAIAGNETNIILTREQVGKSCVGNITQARLMDSCFQHKSNGSISRQNFSNKMSMLDPEQPASVEKRLEFVFDFVAGSPSKDLVTVNDFRIALGLLDNGAQGEMGLASAAQGIIDLILESNLCESDEVESKSESKHNENDSISREQFLALFSEDSGLRVHADNELCLHE